MVQTVDFITPVIDDPYDFGCVAAANALSDVWAMGGDPLFCMNLVGFPRDRLSLDVLAAILSGGADTAAAAGAVVVGGHSVDDVEVKYGMSVTGRVTDAALMINRAGRAGDALVLTKPLGTGVLFGDVRRGTIEPVALAAMTRSMKALNAGAARAAARAGVVAATDITGFGLIGHAHQLARASGLRVRLDAVACPRLPGVEARLASASLDGGCRRNIDYVERIGIGGAPGHAALRLLADPQTSGGLLLAVAPERVEVLTDALGEEGALAAAVVGALLAADADRPIGHVEIG